MVGKWYNHNMKVTPLAWILKQHENQKYGDGGLLPYKDHLYDVRSIFCDACDTTENDPEFTMFHETSISIDAIEMACYGHDLIEDTTVSFNDVKGKLGKRVADIIFDVSNELGRNRADRANKTYPKIQQNSDAIIVKLCDRIANTRYSRTVMATSTMYEKYVSEYSEFYIHLHDGGMTHPDLFLENVTTELWNILSQISTKH